jgi:starvation-inducible DNA-binding protein
MSYGSTMKFLRTGYSGAVGGSDSPPSVCEVLCTMRAAYLTYRNAHWQARGPNFYGHHLLFERLYDESKDQIDKLAEQAVGSYGSDAIREDAQIIAERVAEFAQHADPVSKSLAAARTVRAKLTTAFKTMQVDGQLGLGWEDLLTELAQGTDSHIYLLQQTGSSR